MANNKKKETCPICLDNLLKRKRETLILCGHNFCKKCIQTYIRNKVNDGQVLSTQLICQ